MSTTPPPPSELPGCCAAASGHPDHGPCHRVCLVRAEFAVLSPPWMREEGNEAS